MLLVLIICLLLGKHSQCHSGEGNKTDAGGSRECIRAVKRVTEETYLQQGATMVRTKELIFSALQFPIYRLPQLSFKTKQQEKEFADYFVGFSLWMLVVYQIKGQLKVPVCCQIECVFSTSMFEIMEAINCSFIHVYRILL